ncbi:MAG TPA: glycoside hydrolase family 28 protein, partial [Verrucomicrobiota bacterium]|nr:glycoside hydrolase family 28 protein [Verrucomicrobiota bacterium]
GIWLTGPIELKNRIELHVQEGALVLFTPDLSHYPQRTFDVKGRAYTRTMSPLYGNEIEDVAITGRGVFDASGDAWRPVKKMKMTERQWKELLAVPGSVLENNDTLWWPSAEAARDRRPTLMKLVNSRRILLQDATFQNSPGWNLNPTLCEDITIRNITVRNPWYSQNGDGLDLENCRNVIVRDSRFDVGDDAICLKSGKDAEGRRIAVPTENILIENCVVYHGHGGVVIGSEMSSGVRNVRVDNCTFIGTDLGLRFKSTRGRGGIVEKIYISNIRMTDIPTEAIGFNMYYGGQAPTENDDGDEPSQSSATAVSEETPQFRDIWIQDVVCRGARTAVALQGLPEMPIRGIHLKNVSITSERGIACTDAENITLDNVEILNSTGPVISLTASRDIKIDNLGYKPGAETLFHASGKNNRSIQVRNTDLKPAAKDFTFSNGATRDAFRLE